MSSVHVLREAGSIGRGAPLMSRAASPARHERHRAPVARSLTTKLHPRLALRPSRATDASASPSRDGSVPPAIAMSGLPPPLPPTCCATKLTSSPALTRAMRVGGDAGGELHLAALDGGQHDGGGLQLVLELVEGLAQRLRVGAVERGGEHLEALDVDGLQRRVRRPAPTRARPLSAASSFSSDAHLLEHLRRCAPAPPRAAPSQRRRRAAARCLRATAGRRSALSPVTASTRRMPAATPPSATILKRPMSPVRCTCVPPQSSRLRADVEHAHLVAVLLAEQHHRAELLRFVDRHDARVRRARSRGSRR